MGSKTTKEFKINVGGKGLHLRVIKSIIFPQENKGQS